MARIQAALTSLASIVVRVGWRMIVMKVIVGNLCLSFPGAESIMDWQFSGLQAAIPGRD